MNIKTTSIPTYTALYLMVMVAMTIFTSVAVAQTQIRTIEQLNNVRNNLGGNYVLMNDLDFNDDNSYSDPTANKAIYTPTGGDPAAATNVGFLPIGGGSRKFVGRFNGNGFTISNLYINITSTKNSNIGLFGRLEENSLIRELGLVDAYVKGTVTGASTLQIGALAGANNRNASDYFLGNCYATGAVTGTTDTGNLYIGGLVGGNYAKIQNCYATAAVIGSGSGIIRAGGFVGYNNNSINNCYATGAVSGTGDGDVRRAGLVGYNIVGIIQDCYATGAVSGTGNTRGLVGKNLYGSVRNSFWDNEATGQRTSSAASSADGLSTIEFQELTASVLGWSINNWNFGTTSQYPALRKYQLHLGDQIQGETFCAQPEPRAPCIREIKINTIEDLNDIRNDLTGYYVLTQNLDFADPNSYASGEVNDAYIPNNEDLSMANNVGFPPIGDNNDGTDATIFTGTFDGRSFTISNLYINISSTDELNTGLFGVVGAEGTVQNIGVLDIYVKGTTTGTENANNGGFVGSSSGTIRNCYAIGDVTGAATGGGTTNTGGLVGNNINEISNCYAIVVVTGSSTTGGTANTGGACRK